MPTFDRYIGVVYSGAKTPTSSLSGLRVYVARPDAPAIEAGPPPSPRRYWTRRGIAEWLVARLSEDQKSLIGIDHAFSFPIHYFRRHKLNHDWPAFLNDFQSHWPTDEDNVYMDFIRHGRHGNGAARSGSRTWKRLTEQRTRTAKSVFFFDVQGTVAKSTHAGLPWLRYVRDNVQPRPFFWPFDGWDIPNDRSVVVEVYPSLWRGKFTTAGLNEHQRDAFAVAEWMRRADAEGTLLHLFQPSLTTEERGLADIEGWIFGVL